MHPSLLVWCVGVSVGSNSFIFGSRSLSCLTWWKRISGQATLTIWRKSKTPHHLEGEAKIDLWEFVKKCGWNKALFLQSFAIGGGWSCEKRLLFTHAAPSQGWHFILSFCLSVNKTRNWLHTPSPHESQPLILFHSVWEEEALRLACVNYIPNAI